MSLIVLPKTLHQAYSEVSKTQLSVIEVGHRRVLGAKYISYSLWSDDPKDRFSDRYWGQAMEKVKSKKLKIKSALILGLGGGTLAYLLEKFYTPERIDGIEFDKEVINIGKKYFYLNSLEKLNVIHDDAVKWIHSRSQQKIPEARKYDVIFMDVFQVEVTPLSCETTDFFEKNARLLKKGGLLSLNKIFHRQNSEQEIESYLNDKIRPYFKKVIYDRYQKSLGLDNVLIWGRK